MFFRSVTSGFYRFWLPPGYLQLRFRVVTSSFYRFHFGYLRYFQLLHIPKLMSPCIPPPDNKGSTINYLGGVVQNEKKIHWEGRRKKKNGHVGGSPKKNGSRKSAPLPPPQMFNGRPQKDGSKKYSYSSSRAFICSSSTIMFPVSDHIDFLAGCFIQCYHL